MLRVCQSAGRIFENRKMYSGSVIDPSSVRLDSLTQWVAEGQQSGPKTPPLVPPSRRRPLGKARTLDRSMCGRRSRQLIVPGLQRGDRRNPHDQHAPSHRCSTKAWKTVPTQSAPDAYLNRAQTARPRAGRAAPFAMSLAPAANRCAPASSIAMNCASTAGIGITGVAVATVAGTATRATADRAGASGGVGSRFTVP